MTNFSSKNYWEKRYKKNKNSGPGSYGRLAKFKAEIINNFVTEHNIQNITEFGCGDGNQLSYYKFKNYVGFDVSQKAIDMCKQKFSKDNNKKFYTLENYYQQKADLTLSIDVIFHLIEDEVYNSYMEMLFQNASKYVVIYSSNNPNLNTKKAKHVKHRCFTDWINQNASNWNLYQKINNKFPDSGNNNSDESFCDFYIFRGKNDFN